MCVRGFSTRTKVRFMQLRALVGRPRPFREIVVRPRPTATSPSTFAVAALGTATVLTATIIGMSQLGVGPGLSSHIGGRVLAVPQTSTSTSPFAGFGAPAPLPITIPPETIPPETIPPETIPPVTVPPVTTSPDTPSLDVPAGGAADQPNIRSAVEAAAVHPQTPAGIRNQGVTAVSAVLNVPSARTASKPRVTVVSVASAFPLPIVAIVPPRTPVVVVPASKSERADGKSEHAARNHAAKAPKHKRDHAKAPKQKRDHTKAAKATRST
jgi:hypothetical protein